MERADSFKMAWRPLAVATAASVAIIIAVLSAWAIVAFAGLALLLVSIAYLYSLTRRRMNELHHMVREDYLTGVGNQRALWSAIGANVALATRKGIAMSMVMIDLDQFKDVNDRYGHRMGDRVLKAIATTLKEVCRGSDQVFRYGGDEFVVLCPYTDEEGAHKLAKRIMLSLYGLHTFYPRVTACVGVSELGVLGTGLSLIDEADRALLAAKGSQMGADTIALASNLQEVEAA